MCDGGRNRDVARRLRIEAESGSDPFLWGRSVEHRGTDKGLLMGRLAKRAKGPCAFVGAVIGLLGRGEPRFSAGYRHVPLVSTTTFPTMLEGSTLLNDA